MAQSLPGFFIALALGALVATVNFLVTRRAARGSGTALFAVPVLRTALSVGTLAAAYFLAPLTPWSRTWTLVGAAVGLTVPALPYALLLLKETGRHRSGGDGGRMNGEGG
ncbi:MAG: hypothetical protein J6Q17_04060 [Clostridia bacterium]|nr:hypothetical protein [Clostridia bacterium]